MSTKRDASDTWSANRTRNPTLRPTAWPNSSAIRAAKARAASLRGCVCAMIPVMPRPSSRQYCGNCVLLPEPVSPATMSTWFSRSPCRMASRRAEMGRSGSCLNTSAAAARAAACRAAPSTDHRSLAALSRNAYSPRLTACHRLSCAARFSSANSQPRSAARTSMARNRRSNFALAARSAASASTSSLRARFAAANSRSPISSKISGDAAGDSCDAARTSASSSSTLSAHWPACSKSKPTRAAALAELVGAHQRRQRMRHAVQR